MERCHLRAKTKNYLVQTKREHDMPALLESKYTVPIHNQMQLIGERYKSEAKKVDYEAVYDEWKKWVDERYVKPMVARKAKLEEFKAKRKAQMRARKQAVKVSKK
jgi:hypothetical protein